MNKTLVFSIFLALAIIAGAKNATAEDQLAGQETGTMPLIENWHWQYQLSAENQNADGKKSRTIATKDGEIEVKVDQVSGIIRTGIKKIEKKEDLILATVFENENLKSGAGNYYWLLNVKNGSFWHGGQELKEAFESEKSDLEETPFLILPPKIGLSWGDTAETKRDDHWYQWYVEDKETVTVPAGTFECFRIAYRSNPDHEIIWFAPGVGIVKQEYEHHGSISNMKMELIAYGSNS